MDIPLTDDPNFTLYAIGFALLVIILTFVTLKLIQTKSSARNVLIVGLSGSGKTSLCCQLVTNRFVNTVASMVPNSIELNLGNDKSVQLIDIPGYDRLRAKYWDDNKGNSLAVIFVIDSSVLMTNICDVGDCLYTILADAVINGRNVPILIACNKQDEAKAKSSKVIQNQLERELNAIHITKLAALGSTSEDERNALITKGKDFTLSELNRRIEFVNCSAGSIEKEGELNDVWRWLKSIA